MPKRSFFVFPWLFLLFLSGCTVTISQPAAATAAPQNGVSLSTPAPAIPKASQPGTSSSSSPDSIPVTWSNLNLTGKLIFVASTAVGGDLFNEIHALDLSTGGLKTIFQSVPDGWIDSAVVSPDHKQIVMAYSNPDLAQGAKIATPLALFALPMDRSQPPQQLFQLPLKDDQEFEPVWSPDGNYLYFVLANYGVPPEEPNQHFPIFQIFRAAYPDGQPEKILDKAYWPRLSADGSRLVYVSENPDNGTNKLFVANPDGSNPQQIALSGADVPNIIDAPIFSPDGRSILFSAPTPVQSSAIPWLDRLFGVIEVSAHNLSSEWWSVPAGGGAVTQLTHIQAPGLYGSISPDNRYIASYSSMGVFVMEPDGTSLTMVVNNVGGNLGTVNWIP
jgi:Tol biopolymer transport system component